MKRNCFGVDEFAKPARQTRDRAALFAALLVMAFLSSPFTVTPTFAAANCQEPRDFAELARCYLAQHRCLSNYFGVDAPPNYPEALKCFETDNLWVFVALMYFDGQGTPRDVQKAASVLKSGVKAHPDDTDLYQIGVLQKAINRCQRHPRRPCRRLDWCKDLSYTDLDLDICDAVDQVSEEAVFSRAIAGTRSKLSMSDRPMLDRVIANLKAYQLDDMQREYQAYLDASLRDLAGASQAAFVRENFRKLMTTTIEARGLMPVTASAYHAIDDELQRELSGNLRDSVEDWQADLNKPDEKKYWDEDRSKIEDYKKAAEESQLRWVKFGDSCATLASSIYRDRSSQFDPAVSMKAALTKLRIAELRYNPVGPQSD